MSKNVRFTPVSGHQKRKNASDLKSGHWMSALPPIADNGSCIANRLSPPAQNQNPADVCGVGRKEDFEVIDEDVGC